jgi:hypothetical protein
MDRLMGVYTSIIIISFRVGCAYCVPRQRGKNREEGNNCKELSVYFRLVSPFQSTDHDFGGGAGVNWLAP